MSTENTRTTTLARLVNADTGELVPLAEARANELADVIDRLDREREELAGFRDLIVRELARRADARGSRTVEVDGVTYEVNAPTEERYSPDVLRAELEPLVDAGIVDAALLDELIVTPPPKPQPTRVDRRRVATLKRSTEPRLLAALARARTIVGTKRTVKVIDRAIEGTSR
jgi:hypothetical protein